MNASSHFLFPGWEWTAWSAHGQRSSQMAWMRNVSLVGRQLALKGVKANQRCHNSVHAVKFATENQLGWPQISDWDAILFPGSHGIARMVLKNTFENKWDNVREISA